MTKIGAVAISVPSTLLLAFMPVLGFRHKEFVGDTEIQEALLVFIDMTYPMRAEDCEPDVGVRSYTNIEISQGNDYVFGWNGSQYRV